MSLKSTGTHRAKRCMGPASQGKRVHFREGRKNVLRSVQKIVLERPETRRAAGRPKQNTRRPQGGGRDPKQCPGDTQRQWTRDMRDIVGTRVGRAAEEHLVIDVTLDRLLDGVRLAAEHHGSDDSDLPHDVRGQHECDGPGSFDLGWMVGMPISAPAGRKPFLPSLCVLAATICGSGLLTQME
jgi:hypothetical protein